MKNNKIRFWIGVILSVVFLYLALRRSDIGDVYDTILGILPLYLLLSVLLTAVNLFVRAVRWKIILNSQRSIHLRSVFSSLMVGYMINNILPFRAGELGRGFLIAKSEGFSKSAGLASVVMDRIFDLIGLAMYFPFLFAVIVVPTETKLKLFIIGLIGIGFLAVFFLLVIKRELTMQLAKWALGPIPNRFANRLLNILESFLGGIEFLGNIKKVGLLVIVSTLPWLASLFATLLRFRAFQLDLPFRAALVTLIAVNFASALPSAPGQIGIAHYAFFVALSLYSVDQDTAVAFGILSHALAYLITTLPGLIIIWWQTFKSRKAEFSEDLSTRSLSTE